MRRTSKRTLAGAISSAFVVALLVAPLILFGQPLLAQKPSDPVWGVYASYVGSPPLWADPCNITYTVAWVESPRIVKNVSAGLMVPIPEFTGVTWHVAQLGLKKFGRYFDDQPDGARKTAPCDPSTVVADPSRARRRNGGKIPQPVHATAVRGPLCETDLARQWSVSEAWTHLANAKRIVAPFRGAKVTDWSLRRDAYEELRLAESHLLEVTNNYYLRYVAYSPCVTCNPANLLQAVAELRRLGVQIDSSFGTDGLYDSVRGWTENPYCGDYVNSADPRVTAAVGRVTGLYVSGARTLYPNFQCRLELTTTKGIFGRSINHNCGQSPLYYWPIGSGITFVDRYGRIVIEYSPGGNGYWEGPTLPPAGRVPYFIERRAAAPPPPPPPPPQDEGWVVYYPIDRFTCCRESDGVTPHPVLIDQKARVNQNPNARILGGQVFPTRELAQRWLCSHRICPHGPEGTWTSIDGVVLSRTGCPMNCR